MKTNKGLVAIFGVVIVLLVIGGGHYLISNNDNGSDSIEPQAEAVIENKDNVTDNPDSNEVVELYLWPDVNTFDFKNETFLARGAYEDSKNVDVIRVVVDESTEFTHMSSDEYLQPSEHNLQDLHSLLESWVGPEWFFVVKGSIQEYSGILVASEIRRITQ